MNERTRTVTWDDPLATAGAAAGRSGVEFLRAIRDGDVPPPPIAVLLGMGITEIGEGRVVFELGPGEHLYNPIGSVHGGVLATLLDSAMGCAVHSVLPAGTAYTTIDLTVSYVRAVRSSVPLVRAEGEVLSAGRRVATASGRVLDADGTLYAHATTSCLVFPIPT